MAGATTAKSNPATRSSPSDADLARDIAAGDEEALKILMRRHNQTLYRTARSILRDEADAEDVVQEAYLLAYRAMPGFRGDARLSTWLIRIVVNLALRRRQRQVRERALRVDMTDLPEAPETSDEEVREMTPNHAPTPESAASTAELRRLLEAHINRLPELYREVFVLRGIEELDVEETAAVLGPNREAVGVADRSFAHLLTAQKRVSQRVDAGRFRADRGGWTGCRRRLAVARHVDRRRRHRDGDEHDGQEPGEHLPIHHYQLPPGNICALPGW